MPKPVEFVEWIVSVSAPSTGIVPAPVTDVPVTAAYFHFDDGFITFKNGGEAVYAARADLVTQIMRTGSNLVAIPAKDAGIVARALAQMHILDSDTEARVDALLQTLRQHIGPEADSGSVRC